MKEDSLKTSHVYRISPCPSYDVEGMESWLSEMAKDGLILTKDGFYGWLAVFEKQKPQNIKYRLEAAQKSTSMWADDMGEPDKEAVDISKKYGWNYVAKRGDFYIYCSSEPGTRELNTDPDVQALALTAVQKRQRGAIFNSLLWLIIYPIIKIKGTMLIAMLQLHTWFFLFGALLAIWLTVDSIVEAIFLGKLKKKLQNDGTLNHSKNWRKNTMIYHVKRIIQIILIITWVCILINNWGNSILNENKVSLTDYKDDIPFATIKDFAGDGAYNYRTINYLNDSNKISVWTDWLATYNADYIEHADVRKKDGTYLDGGLYVDYHEMINPWLAKRVAMEYYIQDKHKEIIEQLELLNSDKSKLDVDYVNAYVNKFGFQTVIIQNGNKVIHAMFYQTSDSKLQFEDWVKIMAKSIK